MASFKIMFERLGTAIIKARTEDEAYKIAFQLKEEDIEWFDSWELTEGGVEEQ